MRNLRCVVPILLLVMTWCSRTTPDISYEDGIIAGDGTITCVNTKGGSYGIVTDDGEQFVPVNMPLVFREEGLRVRFKVQTRYELGSLYGWGTAVEIVYIQKI